MFLNRSLDLICYIKPTNYFAKANKYLTKVNILVLSRAAANTSASAAVTVGGAGRAVVQPRVAAEVVAEEILLAAEKEAAATASGRDKAFYSLQCLFNCFDEIACVK